MFSFLFSQKRGDLDHIEWLLNKSCYTVSGICTGYCELKGDLFLANFWIMSKISLFCCIVIEFGFQKLICNRMGKLVWASMCESKINPRHVCIVRVTVVELQVVRRLLSVFSVTRA